MLFSSHPKSKWREKKNSVGLNLSQFVEPQFDWTEATAPHRGTRLLLSEAD